MTDHNARQAGITEALHYLQMGIANLELGNGVHMIDFRNAERAILAAHSADARNGEGVALTEDQWIALAGSHGDSDWNCESPDGYLNAVKALCVDYSRIATPAAPAPTKLDADLLATIRTAAETRAEGATTQDGRAVFINYGDSEQQMIDADALACPHCGGSGHVADVRPAPAPAAQAVEEGKRLLREQMQRTIEAQEECARLRGLLASQQTERRYWNDTPEAKAARILGGIAPAECTCPSGNGSLRHPCPVHAVEAAKVMCGCGDQYPMDSYEAGFIEGRGHCENCDAMSAAPADAASEADKRDAERYRWLRSDDIEVPEGQREISVVLHRLPHSDQADEMLIEAALDVEIDAAIQRERQQGAGDA